jgi:Ca-activated chloride channel family protein
MLSFDWPLVFLLLPLPLLFYWLLPNQSGSEAALRVPQIDQWLAAEGGTGSSRTAANVIKAILLIIIWSLLVSAAARPMWRGEPVAQPASGRDLMLAVDISGSMKQKDMVLDNKAVNRLQAVKSVISKFVERRTGDRMGLILFGTNAYLHVPLTFDKQTLITLLDEAQIGFAGEKTAIGDGIGMAVKRLKSSQSNSRVLILLTDGSNTAGSLTPEQATTLAKQVKLKVYSVGIGAEEMMVPGFFGSRRVNPSRDMDESALKQIAAATGGRYFRAANTQDLETIYALLDELEPVEHEAKTIRPQKSLSYLPLAIALGLSFLIALANGVNSIRGRS